MKKLLSVLLVLVALFSVMATGIVIAEAAGVEPRLNNTNSASISFAINSSGKATVSISCLGKSGITSKINAETKIERKWGLLWLDVDGAEWTDSTTSNLLSKTHSIQLSKTGTYRATTKFTVSGSGGANDVIESQASDTY